MLSLKQITESAYHHWDDQIEIVREQKIPFSYNLQINPGNYPEEFSSEDTFYLDSCVIGEAINNSLKSLLKIKSLVEILDIELERIPQKSPKINVELRLTNRLYTVSVEDNGRGIIPENLGKIWQFGFSTFGTNGIGLPAMRSALGKYYGRTEVESVPFVKTKFNFYIPSRV